MRSGFYRKYPNGMTVFVPTGRPCTYYFSMYSSMAQRADEREQAAHDNFIPYGEFVGPEQPLKRAMRELATEMRK